MTVFRRSKRETAVRHSKNRRVADEESVRVEGRENRKTARQNVIQKRRNRKRTAGFEKESFGGNRKKTFAKRMVDANVENSSEETEEKKSPSVPKMPKAMPFVYGTLRFMAVLACIAAVVWGGKLVYDYATTSSYFAVQHIEIEGNNRLSNAKVVGAAGFAAGDNIFSLDLVKVEHNLMMQPWIVNAKVRQQLPKTVIIDIVERKPEMLVLFDVPYLVDETGEIFKRWAIGDPLPDCVVTGISKREILEDIEGAQKIILDAISLRDRYYSTGNQRYAKLYEIHREIDGGFSLSVGDNPFYIKMGKPPFRKKLSRLAQLLRKIGKEGKQPQIVYFDNEKRPDRVTVKMKFSTENQ